MLTIKDLTVSVEGQTILSAFSLHVEAGEIHAIMGPNGAGKSTLAKVLAGHPAYSVERGQILFCGEDLLELEPDERARAGLFMSFQYPVEIPGVSNRQFLEAAYKARFPESEAFEAVLAEKQALLKVRADFLDRNLNEGFSGGEKKRNEILQMHLLNPQLAILDETDSGLDIDAMRVVADGVNQFMQPNKGLILITHYQRLLNYIRPTVVHVMQEGTIVRSGGPELAEELEARGYQWLEGSAHA